MIRRTTLKAGFLSKTHWLAVAVLLFLLLASAAVGAVFSGLLVTPTASAMSQDTPVKSRDILDIQYLREQEILADYAHGSYTPQKPYLIQDPYQANPLSAFLLFETFEPAQVTVSAAGKDLHSTYAFTSPGLNTHHELPVLGLYPGQANRVSLVVRYANGQSETAQLDVQTEPLPADFPKLELVVSKPEKMEPGLDLMTACLDTNYSYLLDANGDVRGYFSDKNFGHCTSMQVLQNGRLLATGDVMKLMPYNMYTLWEMNLLGKVFVEYEIPNGVHHDIIELENGDFLAASNNAGMPLNYDTREDVIIRIDRASGKVAQAYDLRKILDERRAPYNHYDPGIKNTSNRDWAHLNAVDWDANAGRLLASSPIQSAVIQFSADTQQIDWILSSPEGWDGPYSQYQPYLLAPLGASFEWQWGQHAARYLPDADGDPDTVDILLFDNGQNRSFTQQNSLSPADNYSRAVIYRVHQKARTVEQLWQYGRERASQAYATFLGDADLLKQTGNISITFGGMLRANGAAVDDIVAGVLGNQQIQSKVVEVSRDGEVVFEISVTPNHTSDAATYQVTKLDLYSGGAYRLASSRGQRKGEAQAVQPVKVDLPKFFIASLSFHFKQLYVKDSQLILQGDFQYQGQTYTLGKVYFVLKNTSDEYIFPANGGLNSSFQAVIGLRGLKAGEYALYAAGGVVEGLDAAGKIKSGYIPTGYKVQVP